MTISSVVPRNRDHPVAQREVAASDANPALAEMDGDPQLARFEPPSSSTAAVIETGTSRSVRNARGDGRPAMAAGRNDVNRTLMLVPALRCQIRHRRD